MMLKLLDNTLKSTFSTRKCLIDEAHMLLKHSFKIIFASIWLSEWPLDQLSSVTERKSGTVPGDLCLQGHLQAWLHHHPGPMSGIWRNVLQNYSGSQNYGTAAGKVYIVYAGSNNWPIWSRIISQKRFCAFSVISLIYCCCSPSWNYRSMQ